LPFPTESERQELPPSGQSTVLLNRVQWAKTYLKKAGLLSQPSRGRVRITPEGKAALARKPKQIDNAFLSSYPSFVAFVKPADPEPEARSETLGELLEASYQTLTRLCSSAGCGSLAG
jgi:restriction system protein